MNSLRFWCLFDTLRWTAMGAISCFIKSAQVIHVVWIEPRHTTQDSTQNTSNSLPYSFELSSSLSNGTQRKTPCGRLWFYVKGIEIKPFSPGETKAEHFSLGQKERTSESESLCLCVVNNRNRKVHLLLWSSVGAENFVYSRSPKTFIRRIRRWANDDDVKPDY